MNVNLFDYNPLFAVARRSDPDTSKAAGRSLDPTDMELRVLGVIKSFGIYGGISDDVVGRMPDIDKATVTPRYKGLLEKGLIVDTGERRKGRSGRSQRVMIASAS